VDYKPPYFLFNAHLETIYPSLLRKVNCGTFQRERITTPDDDFLDLDWLKQKSSSLIIISHGLEGSSKRPYVMGMARAGFEKGFDILAWNYRGCSEEMNKQLRFYHSGATDDLDVVIQHAVRLGYQHIHLIGFSLGGNLTLKYLGEQGHSAPIEKCIVFSVPLDLHSSCVKISQPGNWIYANRFLKSLKKKVTAKSLVKSELDITGIDRIKTLVDFDDRFTAPIHGFQNAVDYYTRSSSLYYLASIAVPTLIINARNDPFLSERCYPVNEVKNHPFIQFENPVYGGHVGFAQFRKNGLYWSEERAIDFLTS